MTPSFKGKFNLFVACLFVCFVAVIKCLGGWKESSTQQLLTLFLFSKLYFLLSKRHAGHPSHKLYPISVSTTLSSGLLNGADGSQSAAGLFPATSTSIRVQEKDGVLSS